MPGRRAAGWVRGGREDSRQEQDGTGRALDGVIAAGALAPMARGAQFRDDEQGARALAEEPDERVTRASREQGPQRAIIALARRRLNVLWVLIRDGRPFALTAPQTPAELG